MKCSHGLPYEVKCSGCFKDAMDRISASQPGPAMEQQLIEAAKQLFTLGSIQTGVDKNPRPL